MIGLSICQLLVDFLVVHVRIKDHSSCLPPFVSVGLEDDDVCDLRPKWNIFVPISTINTSYVEFCTSIILAE